MKATVDFVNRIMQGLAGLILNRSTSLKSLAAQLEATGRVVLDRAGQAADTEHNRRVLSHIVGIERWGQRRLSVFLGEPLVMDEYDSYRPERGTSWAELKAQFETTRAQTLSLVQRLEAAQPSQTVPHNQFGPLSAAGWLRYLNLHAAMESRKIRR